MVAPSKIATRVLSTSEYIYIYIYQTLRRFMSLRCCNGGICIKCVLIPGTDNKNIYFFDGVFCFSTICRALLIVLNLKRVIPRNVPHLHRRMYVEAPQHIMKTRERILIFIYILVAGIKLPVNFQQ